VGTRNWWQWERLGRPGTAGKTGLLVVVKGPGGEKSTMERVFSSKNKRQRRRGAGLAAKKKKTGGGGTVDRESGKGKGQSKRNT